MEPIPFKDTHLTFSHYKEPLKKIEKEKGFGYYGVLLSTIDGLKVQCHICGELFGGLNSHIWQKHNTKARAYKEKFELAYLTALISEHQRQAMKVNTLAWLANLTPEQKKKIKAKWIKAMKEKKRSAFQPKLQLESMNKRGTCPDQVLDKIKQVELKLGHTPSLEEFVYECGTQRYKHLIFKMFGSWTKALELCELQPVTQIHKTGPRNKYTDEELLECLRVYAKETKVMPTATDFRRNFLPKMSLYVSHFGSIENARQLAGVYDYCKKPQYNQWLRKDYNPEKI